MGEFIVLDDIAESARDAALELCLRAGIVAGQTVVIGCSTSEINGYDVGTNSNAETGLVVFKALYGVFAERGIDIAAQCCEHLNRVLIVERQAAAGLEVVNVIPTIEAGGAFAAAAFAGLSDPVAVDAIKADAGLDIGGTLIGMHLKRVAVPIRLEASFVGKAAVVAARTRPMFVGGDRAKYNEALF